MQGQVAASVGGGNGSGNGSQGSNQTLQIVIPVVKMGLKLAQVEPEPLEHNAKRA